MRGTLPAWLDGQTIAIIGTMLTVGVGIGAMILASTSAMRGEMNGLRTELSARIENVRKELTTKIDGLDARLRVVEQSMAASSVGVPDLQARVRELEAHARQPADAAHPSSMDDKKR